MLTDTPVVVTVNVCYFITEESIFPIDLSLCDAAYSPRKKWENVHMKQNAQYNGVKILKTKTKKKKTVLLKDT